MSSREKPIRAEEPRAGLESGSGKNAGAREEHPPLAWSLYLIMAAIAALWGFLYHSSAAFFLGLGFLGMAELTVIRRAWELAAQRARQRLGWPPTEPPLRDGAKPEELALAWATIACRAAELGQHSKAAWAWQRCDAALRREGGMS